jgi:hypothetical protein
MDSKNQPKKDASDTKSSGKSINSDDEIHRPKSLFEIMLDIFPDYASGTDYERTGKTWPKYTEYDNPAYHRGMFIDTNCKQAWVHNYKEMEDMLRMLISSYPSDVRMLSAGKSEGYGGPENKLDVWGIEVFATEKPDRTAFFFSGHHPEYSGPETVYLIAKHIMESHYLDNQNVKEIRKNTHLVFIPQIDADLFNNLDKANPINMGDYFEKGYSWLIDQTNLEAKELQRLIWALRAHDMNTYTFNRNFMSEPENFTFKQNIDVLLTLTRMIGKYGTPFIAIDYHEQLKGSDYLAFQLDTKQPLYYVFAEVAKSYPVPTEAIVTKYATLPPEHYQKALINFVNRHDGAASFFTEAPGRGYTNGYSLAQRIEMNLIATDRILARHYMGF